MSWNPQRYLFYKSVIINSKFKYVVTVPGYAASKGAISSLTKALSNEWAGKGVNVNAIAPDYIATDNTEALRDAGGRQMISRARPFSWHPKLQIMFTDRYIWSTAGGWVDRLLASIS